MKKKIKNVSGIVFLFVLLAAAGALLIAQVEAPISTKATNSTPTAPTLAELDELMNNKNMVNCQKAIEGYEALLKNDPGSSELLCKVAKAYVAIIDIETDALIVEKDEYKPALKKYGKTAYDYALKAYTANPKNKDYVATCLAAYGYYSASFGIFKAIMKGAAGKFKDLANELIVLDPTYLGAMGYRSLGKFYHVAPWPAGSTKKAMKYFIQAIETDPKPLDSHYYLGVIYFEKDKFDLAKKEFTFVVQNEPWEDEKHYIAAYKKDAQNYLTKIYEEETDD